MTCRERQPIRKIPNPLSPPSGCSFHPRCPFARKVCQFDKPLAFAEPRDMIVACHGIAEGWMKHSERQPIVTDGGIAQRHLR